MNLELTLILQTKNFNSNTLIDLIEYNSSLIDFTKFGYTEPLKNKVERNNLSKVKELYEKYLSIILKGKKKLWLSGSASLEGILMFNGGIELKNTDIKQIDEIINFMHLFSRNEQLLYGYFCSEDEYNDKHKYVEGSAVGWKGVSKADFFGYSPGIHWYTIIGKELAKAIGLNNNKNIIGVNYYNPGDESIAFSLDSPIDKLEQRQKEIEEIEQQIGKNFFFNMKADEKSLSHPESFKTFLNNLSPGF
jgi:hypothetical protein